MSLRLANEEATLSHAGMDVRLRPSLRAATQIERSHDGLLNLERRIFEFHTGTIREIIFTTAIDELEGKAFLVHFDRAPLKDLVSAIVPALISLCAGFIPQPRNATGSKANGTPQPFSELYADLYEYATGWLGWTPETAWNATPTEIDRAYSGHIAKLKTIDGGDNDTHSDPLAEVSPETVKQGISRLRELAGRA